MDSYQGTHKRAYENFGLAGRILLPIGISLSSVFLVLAITFAIFFASEASGFTSPQDWTPLATLWVSLLGASWFFFAIGIMCLVPGIVFTILSKSFRQSDEQKGIDYSEFDKKK